MPTYDDVVAARRELVRRLTLDLVPARVIAAQLGVTERTVVRDRVALGVTFDWPPRQTTHGTRVFYRAGCRCAACWAAGEPDRTNARTASDRRRARGARLDGTVPHGQSGYTNYGCRCDVCTAANSVTSAAYRARRKAARESWAGLAAVVVDAFTASES